MKKLPEVKVVFEDLLQDARYTDPFEAAADGHRAEGIQSVRYRAVIAICSIAFGLALDVVYLGMGIATTSIAGSMSEVLPHEVKMIFAVLMLPMMAYATYRSMRTTHLK